MNDSELARALLSAMGIELPDLDMVHPAWGDEVLQFMKREPLQALRFGVLLTATYFDGEGFTKSACLLRLMEKAVLRSETRCP